MHRVYPPKFCITIVLHFSWDECNTPEKLETAIIQILGGWGGGINKVHYGLCERSEYATLKIGRKLGRVKFREDLWPINGL